MNEYLPYWLFAVAGLMPAMSPPIEEKRRGFGTCKKSRSGYTKVGVIHYCPAKRHKNKMRRQSIRRARKMAA